MAVKKVPYTDREGRRFTSTIPVEVGSDEAARGVLVGPPDLAALELPAAIEVRLHNELHARGITSAREAGHRRTEVAAALMAALRVDAEAIVNAYILAEKAG